MTLVTAPNRLAEFAATVALCEYQNGDWPDNQDLEDMRPTGEYVARAVLAALKAGTARGFEESGWKQGPKGER